MNAVDAKTGKLEWQSGSLGPGFGASGAFYSTPAVAFGRVYAGNNDAPRLQLRPPRRHPRLELLDRRLRLLRPRRRDHPAQPADRLHRLLRRQRLRARRQGRRACAGAARPGARWSARSRRSATSSTSPSSPVSDQGLHDEERPRGLHLPARHLHAGDLRRPPPLPHRLLEHHRPAAVQVSKPRSPSAVVAPRSKAEAKKPKKKPLRAAKPSWPARSRRQAARRRRGRHRRAGREGGEERVVEASVEHREAGRVVLDPVGAGGAEVLVVDEHLAAPVALTQMISLLDVGGVVAAGDARTRGSRTACRRSGCRARSAPSSPGCRSRSRCPPSRRIGAGVEMTGAVLRDGGRAGGQRAPDHCDRRLRQAGDVASQRRQAGLARGGRRSSRACHRRGAAM